MQIEEFRRILTKTITFQFEQNQKIAESTIAYVAKNLIEQHPDLRRDLFEDEMRALDPRLNGQDQETFDGLWERTPEPMQKNFVCAATERMVSEILRNTYPNLVEEEIHGQIYLVPKEVA